VKNYKFLNNINFPSDLRKLPEDDLQKVSDEVREEMISAVSETGGHLGAGLRSGRANSCSSLCF
jgi:1-deoxy-D-xylulose-5-phosphate synthase